MQATLGKDHADSILIRTMTSAAAGDLSKQAIADLATGMRVEPEDAGQVVEDFAKAYFGGAANYIERAYGIEDGMDVINWLEEALAPEGAQRFVTSLVAGSTVLVDEAVEAYIQRR